MFRSMSSRSTNRTNASTDDADRGDPLADHSAIKKALSQILHKIHPTSENCPEDTEMHEFISCTSTSEDNLHRSQSSISLHFPHPPTVHEKLANWKKKFQCRSEQQIDVQHEKNTGYLVVSNPEADPVLVPEDCFDPQATRQAQACVQENTTPFDANQIQYSSVTSIASLAIPHGPTSLILYCPPDEADVQATRPSAECGLPLTDHDDVKKGQPISQIASATSTNASLNEFTGVDRSTLADDDYVRAQELDLHRLFDLEIDLCKELSQLQVYLEDESQVEQEYECALQLNTDLEEELRLLQENNPLYSSWTCEWCTSINPPCTDINRNVCYICQSPGPLKQAALMR